jgi:CRISPR/Cas system CMR-associated protein Cmr5 small subunit
MKLTGNQLLQVVNDLKGRDIKDIAIKCGYYFEEFDSVIIANLGEFTEFYTKAGGHLKDLIINP